MIDRAIFELPGVRRILAQLVCSGVLQALCIIGQAWFLGCALANLWDGQPLAEQVSFVALFFVCFVAKQGIVNVEDARLDSYAYKQADDLRQQLLKRVFTTKAQVVRDNGTGNVTAAVLEGVDQVQTYFHLILPKITSIVTIPLVILVFTLTLDWVSALIMFIMFPFIVLYMIILGRNAKDEASKQYRTFQVLSNHFIDTLRGIDTLKLLGASKRHATSIFEVSERFRAATMKTLRMATLSSFVLDMFSTLSIAAVAFMLGMRLLDGSVQLLPALAILVVAPEYFKPIRNFASDYHASLDGVNALKSIQHLIGDNNAPDPEVPLAPWQATSTLTLAHVGCAYPSRRVLDDVTLTFEGFQKYGIVGTSGAGKSTLANLLGGFLSPDSGHIAVQGVPVPGLHQADWQSQIAYIPQDPYIFHATLRENIAFYRPDATRAEIERAVSIVGLDKLVGELPQGLDTLIGEGARGLSGGQAQRIALARAFLDDARRILIFDEPTAHLDIETEMELKERMLPLMENHLVLFATHRLHWLHDMDTVIVLEEGRIAERGSLSELSGRDGALTRLASQMAWDAA